MMNAKQSTTAKTEKSGDSKRKARKENLNTTERNGDKDILRLLTQIQNELDEIKEEREKIEETVLRQMKQFWDTLPIDRKKSLNQKTFIELYKDGLKAKIMAALEQAEKRLLSRKKQLVPLC